MHGDAGDEIAQAVTEIWRRHYRPAPPHWKERSTAQADRLASALIIAFNRALKRAAWPDTVINADDAMHEEWHDLVRAQRSAADPRRFLEAPGHEPRVDPFVDPK